ncbi:MAG: hypothetical protein ACRC2M_02205, partial [Planktothrix sp.]
MPGSLNFCKICPQWLYSIISNNSSSYYFSIPYAVQFTLFARPQHSAWNGEELTVRSSFLNVNGKDKVSLEGKFDGQP